MKVNSAICEYIIKLIPFEKQLKIELMYDKVEEKLNITGARKC